MKKYPFVISELEKLIGGYFDEYLTENPAIVPDTESLAAYLGITRDELNELETEKAPLAQSATPRRVSPPPRNSSPTAERSPPRYSLLI